ncbi:MAG: cytidine deaminase [Anaeroplasmataceae bacterium]
MNLHKLNLELAKKASLNSYSKYSKFKVGCAIELKSGEYILGTNIENVSFGLSNCAERSALFSTYSQGFNKQDIKSLTIYADQNDFIYPCGACRQVFIELLDKDTKIYLSNNKLEIKEVTISELMPYSFDKF